MARALIVQLGRTGLSFARFYREHGYEIDIVDTRAEPPAAADLEKVAPELRPRRVASYRDLELASYDAVAVSPGVPPAELPPDTSVLGDLDCFLNEYQGSWAPATPGRPQLVAVTGTNGKSTVAHLTVDLLVAAGHDAVAVGNIGYPMLDAWLDWEQRQQWPDYIVLELSSFQLARLGQPLMADVACVLNCAPDHLDWHGDFASYRAAKEKIYEGARIGVFNHAEAGAAAAAGQADVTVSFGTSGPEAGAGWTANCTAITKRGAERGYGQEQLLSRGIMPLSACAALTIAEQTAPELKLQVALNVLARSKGLRHRFEQVACEGELRFINDSKSTNVAAAAAALAALSGPCVLIAGGDDKGQDFGPLLEAVRAKAQGVIVIDDDDCKLAQALRAGDIEVRCLPSMQEAVAAAAEQARELGIDTVLLSPACASFDRYADYAARGEAFTAAVEQLQAGADRV